MWAWKRHSRAIKESRAAADAANQTQAAAEAHRKDVQEFVSKSMNITDGLRRELAKNGWTELLQHAWGAR